MTASTKGPGRPVDPARRERILEAALTCMAEEQNFNMQQVAARAGVAKGTLYRHFPNADALLLAVLERHHSQLAGQVDASAQNLQQVREHLLNLGLQLVDFFSSEAGIRLLRAVYAYGASHPQHGEMIFRDGPMAFVRRAAEHLQQAADLGAITLDDPLLRAEQLVGMWKGSLMSGLLMNGCHAPTIAQREERVVSATDLLLNALACQKT
ncbi:MAG: TetR/AcrR family transcriptional regulator [Halopseudomonas yangmingensis]